MKKRSVAVIRMHGAGVYALERNESIFETSEEKFRSLAKSDMWSKDFLEIIKPGSMKAKKRK